jgi:adenosylcobinamide-GDP ribazoletransferase
VNLNGLLLATQFLTRLRVPAPRAFSERDIASSAWWFPVIGALVGTLVALVIFGARFHGPLLAASLGVVAWAWITGAMHLDGLADLTDALGAAHRDPQRFLAVLADPHAGTFGVVSIALVLLLKFALLAELHTSLLGALVLIPAWARLGALAWTRWLPPLKAGHARSLATGLPTSAIVAWGVLLIVVSAIFAPVLLLSPLVIAAWGIWLRVRVGGMTGDCLGAGIEVSEVVLLAVLSVGSRFFPAISVPV